MNTKLLLILVLGLFVLWSGCRSLGGHEDTVQIDWAGEESTITCDSEGAPIDGPGFLTPQAEEACQAEVDDQRGRAPLWIVAGLALLVYGGFQTRSALKKK